ncbi:MAG: IPT/TIG domain-containing protein [Planctomycetes bacterium]|nr:IPT/TIG domain-containing protein [Planctomycetota bacterium]
MSHFTRLGAVCMFAAFFDESSFAGTINVPADVSTIQGAIDAASPGDTVLVAPGTYVENIDFKGKAIKVRSSDGASLTTIDGGQRDSVVIFQSGEGRDSILQGFTITNGNAQYGGGIRVSSSAPSILDNVVTSNSASTSSAGSNGGGIRCDVGSPLIARNTISLNIVQGDGGGLSFESGATPTIESNVIYGNSATGAGGGVQCYDVAITITNCTVFGNNAPTGGSGILAVIQSVTVNNSIVRSNTGEQLGAHDSGQFIVQSSNIEGGWQGNGNVDVDPLFVDALGGDFHLSLGSPCIDAGDPLVPGLPLEDVDGQPRTLGAAPDMGADEASFAPSVIAVSPMRARYDSGGTITVSGNGFTIGAPLSARLGSSFASNVVVLDDSTLTCDLPLGDPGPVEVGVANAYGEGVLADGFIYSPALLVTGDPVLGGTLTLDFYCDSLNAIYAIAGFPPAVSLKTKPFDGTLCIDPSYLLFWVPLWPFDQFTLQVDIPNDSSLSGMTLLSQALIGPRLGGRNKDGAWTNCVSVTIP